jgi:CRISPR-associated endonuclease/helicase Cas3
MAPSDWHLDPEREAILIGTQDMLLSRALNRGYGSGRARWPMEYGLLNVDCLWVLDEIQLMDVGLATSCQLQGFANADEGNGKLPRPRRTWWMSATLQRDWLRRAPALMDAVDKLPQIELKPEEQRGELYTAAKKIRMERIPAKEDSGLQKLAELVANAHSGGITLAVVNTVKTALGLYQALKKLKKADIDLRLVHSRFRGTERRKWAVEFLDRLHCKPGQNRIIVSTQVVEAGVDISADVLVTELAPWPSLVQRFGRCARYGGTGEIIVVDRRHTDETAEKLKGKDRENSGDRQKDDREIARPYDLSELEAAAEAIARLQGMASAAAIEQLEKNAEAEVRARLYPYAPAQILTRRELRDLFDTGPDLTGADIDISRFVRGGEERDVIVWWWPIRENESPHPRLRPSHDALCRIPVGEVRSWLFPGGKSGKDTQEEDTAGSEAPKPKVRAWVWSYLDDGWEQVREHHIYPGQTILVDALGGGYDVEVGFTGKAGVVPVEIGHVRGVEAVEAADSAEGEEDLSEGLGDSSCQYKTIATHAAETVSVAEQIAEGLGLPSREKMALELACMTHDIGKAHPAFAAAIKDRNQIPLDVPLAKAPKGRWYPVRNMYNHSHLGERPGFRHELASALAILELVWRARPSHPAIHGGREALLDKTCGLLLPDEAAKIKDSQGVLAELLELESNTLNLVLYLVMCHHGKIRATVPMSPRDQDYVSKDGQMPIRGVMDDDELPALTLATPRGEECRLPNLTLRLDVARIGLSSRYGPSWVERVLDLRACYGDFQLAWLEAVIRTADVRASQISQPLDPRLPPGLAMVSGVEEEKDPDAELQEWIRSTIAAATSSPSAVGARAEVKGGTRKQTRKPRAQGKDGGAS